MKRFVLVAGLLACGTVTERKDSHVTAAKAEQTAATVTTETAQVTDNTKVTKRTTRRTTKKPDGTVTIGEVIEEAATVALVATKTEAASSAATATVATKTEDRKVDYNRTGSSLRVKIIVGLLILAVFGWVAWTVYRKIRGAMPL